MKSVIIFSSVTFLLIFGGISALSLQLAGRQAAGEDLSPQDAAASERLLYEVAAERDRVQRDREYLAGLRQSQAAREVVMGQVHEELLEIIGRLESKQSVFVAEQEEAASRLAKMYEAMKPEKAANILAAMDRDVCLAILARMKERSAANVLARMDAGLAAQLSTRLSLQGGA
jgi:flagellar motility protein MotE (MotC chaperone)